MTLFEKFITLFGQSSMFQSMNDAQYAWSLSGGFVEEATHWWIFACNFISLILTFVWYNYAYENLIVYYRNSYEGVDEEDVIWFTLSILGISIVYIISVCLSPIMLIVYSVGVVVFIVYLIFNGRILFNKLCKLFKRKKKPLSDVEIYKNSLKNNL